MLEWQKRCKKVDTFLAERRQWWTRCKQYYIEESNLRYGRKRSENKEPLGYPIVFRLMIKRGERFDILSAHRTKPAAVKALEYYVEHRKLPPKQTKAKRRQKAKRQQKAKRKRKATK